jgi:hypothetical protein
MRGVQARAADHRESSLSVLQADSLLADLHIGQASSRDQRPHSSASRIAVESL